MAYGKIRVDTLTWDNSGTPTDVTIATLPTAANPTFTGAISLNAQGDFRYYDSDSSNYVGFQAPGTVSSNVLWTLPGADGSAGQQLSTDGSGTLSWSDATNVQAASLTGTTMAANVVASSLTSVGTLSSLTIDGDVTFTGASSNGLWDKSADAFVADLTGTASIATTVTVADESSDTTCFPLFATAATGNLGPKSGTNLTFNANTGALAATSFTGNLLNCTGNAATATALETARTIGGTSFDGSANIAVALAATATTLATARNIGGVSFDGSANIDLPGVNTAGNQDTSGTAALATQFTVSANNSTNETVYPIFVDGATGSQGGETDTGLSYNPSSGALSSTTFIGALTGNSTTATKANSVQVDDTSDTNCFPMLTASGATGQKAVKSSSNLSFNSSSGALTATSFVGDLTGDVTGDVTGNTSGSSGSCTGNSATATTATNVTVSANNSSNETVYPLFVDGATGTQGAETDTGLTYNPSSGLLTSTGFAGALTGNVTGNCSGSSGSCTGNAATADAVDTTATSTDANHYLTFVDSSSSTAGETIRMDSDLTYNPSDNKLTVPSLDVTKTQETFQTVTHSSSGGLTINFNSGNIIYLNQGANITAVGFSNCPGSKAFSFTIVRKNTAGSALSITWSGAFKWPSGGTAPTLTNTSNAIDILTFITFDGGSTVYSIKTGTNFA